MGHWAGSGWALMSQFTFTVGRSPVRLLTVFGLRGIGKGRFRSSRRKKFYTARVTSREVRFVEGSQPSLFYYRRESTWEKNILHEGIA